MSPLLAHLAAIIVGAAIGIPAGMAGVWCINHLAAFLLAYNGAT
jgi:hypothetical protein